MSKLPSLPYNYLPAYRVQLRPNHSFYLNNNLTATTLWTKFIEVKITCPILFIMRLLCWNLTEKELQVIYSRVMISKRASLKSRRINKVCNYTVLMTVEKTRYISLQSKTSFRHNQCWNHFHS